MTSPTAAAGDAASPPDGVRAPGEDAVVQVRGVSKCYRSKNGALVWALDGVDLTIRESEVVSVVGPSGCGKTTLLRIVGGLDGDYSGDVIFAEDGPRRGQPGRLPATVVFQQDSLLPWMTAERNIILGMSGLNIGRGEAERRARAYLEVVGLGHCGSQYPHELSGGMRQRVAIARALACEPRLLLMDEPLAALDAQSRILMQESLLKIWDRTRSTSLYITHDIEEAVTVGDRVAVMSRGGRIVCTRRTPEARREISHGLDIMTYRSREDVSALVNDIWHLIRTEVGVTL